MTPNLRGRAPSEAFISRKFPKGRLKSGPSHRVEVLTFHAGASEPRDDSPLKGSRQHQISINRARADPSSLPDCWLLVLSGMEEDSQFSAGATDVTHFPVPL